MPSSSSPAARSRWDSPPARMSLPTSAAISPARTCRSTAIPARRRRSRRPTRRRKRRAAARPSAAAAVGAIDGASALMRAALALPILALPAKAGAAAVGEVGFAMLGYKERGLMKVSEPLIWGRAEFAEVWEVRGSALVDIITGASPQLVTNQ